jgi:hypothetical protein
MMIKFSKNTLTSPLLLLALGLLFFGCSHAPKAIEPTPPSPTATTPPPPPAPKPPPEIPFAQSPDFETQKILCEKEGGQWLAHSKQAAVQNNYSCYHKSADAGKFCKDGAECATGFCFYNKLQRQGYCGTYFHPPTGCFQIMKNGIPELKKCID